jgi:hypothetical protein
MVRIRRPAQLRLQLFRGGMEDDIYQQLKELEEQHVRAVRVLEKLAKALEHVREARTELVTLARMQTLTLPSLIFLSSSSS